MAKEYVKGVVAYLKSEKKLLRNTLIVLGILVFALIICLPSLVYFLTERLWYIDVGYLSVFWQRISVKVVTGLVAALVAFVFVELNMEMVRRYFTRTELNGSSGVNVDRFRGRAMKYVALTVSLFAAIAVGFSASGLWVEIQQFIKGVPFGTVDPIFGRDISFYMFKLPIVDQLYGLVMGLLGMTTVFVVIAYFVGKAITVQKENVDYERPNFSFVKREKDKFNLGGIDKGALMHISILVALMFVLKGFGYILQMFNLVYSTNGMIFGAGYTDVKALLPGLKVLAAIAVVCAITSVFAGAKKKPVPLIASICVLLVSSLVVGTVYPQIVQKLYVDPNQLEAEREYIDYHLDFTRAAYGLDDIDEREFDYDGEVTAQEVDLNAETISNIRLWDWQPLLSTYSQLQEMRLYYKFQDVDIDRYVIDGQTKQVMIAAREMDVDSLPTQGQTWINRHLKYTHGYGAVATPVNEVAIDGLPTFLVQDIPPKGPEEMKIERPEIYFGEKSQDYIIVNTKTDEFDYPIGESNSYNRYEGSAGVDLSGLSRKVLYALKFNTPKILLSTDITDDSKVIYYRSIGERVKKIAPFLVFDDDPYIIIDDGKLVWMYDAYTISGNYPFSQPYNPKSVDRVNYIRNSVKVTVDAYNGDMNFYVVDSQDPIINTYSQIFPDIFRPISDMPDSLRAHMRYPEDMFAIQANMYCTYHMRDASVFYNKEDYWNIPNEVYGNAKQVMSPYYVNMVLPEEQETNFSVIMPFTPASKDNMVAWMAAKCDGEDYGKIVSYKFTKQRIVYGPMQVEAQIDQDGEISKLLSLWNQQGSSVIRGNMIVYPLGNAFLYIEPLFMAAERSQLPQLKLVVVSDGTRVFMGDNLQVALENMLSGQRISAYEDTEAIDYSQDTELNLSSKALDIYERSQERIKSGDWAGFGELQGELEQILRELASRGR